jgi:two-component sensor histidine kinase
MTSNEKLASGAMPSIAAPRTTPWYWLCQFSGWGLVALVNVSFSLANKPEVRYPLVLISLWGGLAGIVLSHGWRRHLHRHAVFVRGRALPLARLVAGVLILTVTQVTLVGLGFMAWPEYPGMGNFIWLPPALAFWLFMFACWTVFYGAVMASRHTKRAEIEKLQLQIQVQDAEFRALQSQVNPHFFFNSLNSVRALMYQDVPAAAQVVDRLAEMMRYNLQMGQDETVTLERELCAVRSYLAVEKVRFEERMQVVEQIDTTLNGMAVPALAIQTLVENAVKYGVEMRTQGCEIRISAQRESGHVRIAVANQGVLQSAGQSTQIGLENTSRRLALLFDGNASLRVVQDQDWVVASLALPEEYR